MLKILRSEIFITLMQAVFLASLLEFFLGNGHIDSGVIYIAMLFSSVGLFLGLAVASAAPTPKRKK